MDTQTRICRELRTSRRHFMSVARNYRDRATCASNGDDHERFTEEMHRAIKTAKAYTLAYLEQKAYWL